MSDIGSLQIQALLNIILGDLVLFFEVGKSMGAEQIKQTIQLILDDINLVNLKPADFKLCFNRLKKGFYGKLYDRLDGQIILDCLYQYSNERDIEIETLQARGSAEFKKIANQPLLTESKSEDDKYDEIFKRNIKKYFDDREERQKNKRAGLDKSPILPNAASDLHNRWIKQFDDLYLRQRGKGRMVRKYGLIKNPFFGENDSRRYIARLFTLNEYLDYKSSQYAMVLERLKQRS